MMLFIDFYKQYSSCFMCNGFYGPHFRQPVCSTCHMFLFPLDINWPDDGAYAEVSSCLMFYNFVDSLLIIIID
jgi:hypothetical protein